MAEEISRRAMLKGAAEKGGVATLLRGGRRSAGARQDEKKLGWCVVALGGLSWGQILPGFAQCKKSKLVAVVTGHPADKGKRATDMYGVKQVYTYDTYDQIKNNPEIDCVYIVLPNGMHAEYTIRAAQAGKHVLTEKPMANTPEDCQAMIDACKKANVKLMVAYRCQYEPHNLEAIRRIRAGEIGKLKVVNSDHGFNAGDPRQWRLNKKLAGGGSLMDIGIYSLQAARYMTGEEPTEISAQWYTTPNDPRFKEVEESINFILKFPSGVLSNCTSSYGYAYANRIMAIGDRGVVELAPATAYSGIRLTVGREPVKFEEMNQFAREMDHFSECVMENKTPKTPGEEGLRDLRLMMKIYEACRTGKAVKA